MHGSQPGCFTLRSMLLEDFFFNIFFWWGGGKPMRFFGFEPKEDLFLSNIQHCGLNVSSRSLSKA